jgi:hypothetical protein
MCAYVSMRYKNYQGSKNKPYKGYNAYLISDNMAPIQRSDNALLFSCYRHIAPLGQFRIGLA